MNTPYPTVKHWEADLNNVLARLERAKRETEELFTNLKRLATYQTAMREAFNKLETERDEKKWKKHLLKETKPLLHLINREAPNTNKTLEKTREALIDFIIALPEKIQEHLAKQNFVTGIERAEQATRQIPRALSQHIHQGFLETTIDVEALERDAKDAVSTLNEARQALQRAEQALQQSKEYISRALFLRELKHRREQSEILDITAALKKFNLAPRHILIDTNIFIDFYALGKIHKKKYYLIDSPLRPILLTSIRQELRRRPQRVYTRDDREKYKLSSSFIHYIESVCQYIPFTPPKPVASHLFRVYLGTEQGFTAKEGTRGSFDNSADIDLLAFSLLHPHDGTVIFSNDNGVQQTAERLREEEGVRVVVIKYRGGLFGLAA
ncbi:hypothetical protein D6783_04580 [Candidatus Woesearchaeota archaeon]|nr:MAG: hypothetical protein D6783_04580 [Candidatus Woesearchaeota archaeon]